MGLLFLLFGYAVSAETVLMSIPPSVQVNEVFSLKPQSGYHFETKAPQKCDGARPIELSAREMKCQFLESGSKDILVSVCDDAKTACHPVHAILEVKPGGQLGARALIPQNSLAINQRALASTLLPGFENASPQDLKDEKKPIFVMIGTDWCPTCNEVKENLLSLKRFREITKDWRLVYVDGDALSASQWERYIAFEGFPTFALLNPNLQEVSRFVDSIRIKDFEKWAAQASTFVHRPIGDVRESVLARERGSVLEKIKDVVFGRDGARERAWYVRYALNDSSMLKGIKEEWVPSELRADYLRAKMVEPGTVGEWKELLEASKNQEGFTHDLDAFCEISKEECRGFVLQLKNRPEFWKTITFDTLAEQATALGSDYYYQSQVFKNLNMITERNAAADKCIDQFDQATKESPLPLARAANIGRLACLETRGLNSKAEKIYQELMAGYGDEPTFLMRYARFLKKQNRLVEAHDASERALKNAYARNWMQASLLKASIEMEMKRKLDALGTLHLALSELKLDSSNPTDVEQRWAHRLRALEQEVLAM